jgi:hypothetical protein
MAHYVVGKCINQLKCYQSGYCKEWRGAHIEPEIATPLAAVGCTYLYPSGSRRVPCPGSPSPPLPSSGLLSPRSRPCKDSRQGSAVSLVRAQPACPARPGLARLHRAALYTLLAGTGRHKMHRPAHCSLHQIIPPLSAVSSESIVYQTK